MRDGCGKPITRGSRPAHPIPAATAEPEYGIVSYSQEGEDLLLLRLLKHRERGFYVDIGACHPKRFSNTYLFYRMGWRGLNVDATPGSMEMFRSIRPDDINIEAAVGEPSQVLPFYCFREAALNTSDASLAERYKAAGYAVSHMHEIRPIPLGQLLDEKLSRGQAIDFLSIDIEGGEMGALRTNNWSRYRPELILVEDLTIRRWDRCGDSEVCRFLMQQRYAVIAKTMNTLAFCDANSPLSTAA